MLGVPEVDHDFLVRVATGKTVLDIGTGECVSANLFAGVASRVTSIENKESIFVKNLERLDSRVEAILGEWDSVNEEYDVVFVDSFPLNERAHIARAWRWRGADVFIHDADMVECITPIDGHRHGDILHINKECRYGD